MEVVETLFSTPLVNMKPVDALKKFDGLLTRIATKYRGHGVELEDLEQEAKIALLQALPLWNDTHKQSLKNFICFRVRSHLKEYRRKNLVVDTVSLDEEIEMDSDGNPITLHDLIGTPALQLEVLEVKETEEHAARLGGKGFGVPARAAEILKMRAEGATSEAIGQRFGISQQAAHKALQKAQKHFAKRAAS